MSCSMVLMIIFKRLLFARTKYQILTRNRDWISCSRGQISEAHTFGDAYNNYSMLTAALFVLSAEKEAAQESRVIVVDASFIVAWPIMALSAQTMRGAAPQYRPALIFHLVFIQIWLSLCAHDGEKRAQGHWVPASALPCIWPFRHSLSCS
jgi:hypothetical protein